MPQEQKKGNAVKQKPVSASKGLEKKANRQQSDFLAAKRFQVIAVAVAAIAIVAGAYYLTLPEEADVDDFWSDNGAVETPKLKMIIITSQECPGCEVNNSLELMFQRNGIDYTIEKIDQGNLEGSRIINDLRIKKLPAYLIDERTITDDMTVETKSGTGRLGYVLQAYVDKGEGQYSNDVFIFPELFLDGMPHSNLILGQECGDSNNIRVHIFTDPYCIPCIAQSRDLENFRQMLEDEDVNAFFFYNYLPTASLEMEEYILKVNVETAAKHLTCASDFGTEEFNPFEQALYGMYCDSTGDVVADRNELMHCSDSNHWGIPLLGDEVMEAMKQVGFDQKITYAACLLDAENRMAAAQEAAKRFGISRTPTVLVNCKYEVPTGNALAAVCKINGSIPFCLR